MEMGDEEEAGIEPGVRVVTGRGTGVLWVGVWGML